MTPFLRQVAQYYHSKGNVHNYCFVLPNHRSCKFFERELELSSNGPILMPEVKTITDFVTSLSGLVAVSPVDALFELFKCYTAISGNEDYSFDQFVYWGNVVLNDFNDVDMYLVDAKEIFTNVREYKEIQANYIGDDLREVMSHYFSLEIDTPVSEEEELMWKKNYSELKPGEELTVRGQYLKLWQIMLELYTSYNEALARRGLSTMGRIYRTAVEALKPGNSIGNKRYVFVGFNMLSTSELAIFKRLSNRNVAQFFWDAASPAFNDKYKDNRGGRLVKFYQREFPEPADFTAEPIEKFPVIEVVGVPSNAGQAKCAFSIIDDLNKNGEMATDDAAIDTAIVLPDEDLFVPLLNSISPDLKHTINITMGYQLSDSDIASLMRIVAKMHSQARRDGDGTWRFYRDDVKSLLSHPLLKSCYGREALQLIKTITDRNLFMVPEDAAVGLGFEPLFHTLEPAQGGQAVINFLQRLVDFCNRVEELIAPQEHEEADENDSDGGHPRGTMLLQEAFLNQYVEVLNRLIDAIARHDVPQCETTVFNLLDRLASVFSIPLEGEPLQGLQVMGLLETRCLDFKNIIITSANERVLPRKFRTNTFITNFLRSYYGMSTTAHQEAMWTYYFYRLISRAGKVYMLYDTSAQSMGSSEHSRFIEQLEKVYGCKMKHVTLSMPVPVSKSINIEIPKNERVLNAVESYRMDGMNAKAFSASSINEYINCPLSFYFHHIEHLRSEGDDADFMDASTFGTIVHETLQELYYPKQDGKDREGEYKVTLSMIEDFEKRDLDRVINGKVNEKYLRSATSTGASLTGEASIVATAIKEFVVAALDYDKKLLQGIATNFFTVLECEREHEGVELTLGGVKFNFRYTADRIDRLPTGELRMVDYKTGRDKTDFADIDNLFEGENRRKAVLQLMLYCNAYAQENNLDGPIMPVIYSLRDMSQAGVKIKNRQVVDYQDYNKEFCERMGIVMQGFFNPDEPFRQAPAGPLSSSPCRYCKFRDFCRR
jgi:hypothetical protein